MGHKIICKCGCDSVQINESGKTVRIVCISCFLTLISISGNGFKISYLHKDNIQGG